MECLEGERVIGEGGRGLGASECAVSGEGGFQEGIGGLRGKGEGGRENGPECGDGDSSGGEESVVIQRAVFDEVFIGLGRGRDFPAERALDD